MCNVKRENSYAKLAASSIPKPPKEIEVMLENYQNFLSSVFTREYDEHYTGSPMLIRGPKLTNDEEKYIEALTKELYSSKGWKNYIKMCKKWAVLVSKYGF